MSCDAIVWRSDCSKTLFPLTKPKRTRKPAASNTSSVRSWMRASARFLATRKPAHTAIPFLLATAATERRSPKSAPKCPLPSTREKSQLASRFTFRAVLVWTSSGPTATRATTILLTCATNALARPATTSAAKRKPSSPSRQEWHRLPRCPCSSPNRRRSRHTSRELRDSDYVYRRSFHRHLRLRPSPQHLPLRRVRQSVPRRSQLDSLAFC